MGRFISAVAVQNKTVCLFAGTMRFVSTTPVVRSLGLVDL